jgi:hypothetical protein
LTGEGSMRSSGDRERAGDGSREGGRDVSEAESVSLAGGRVFPAERVRREELAVGAEGAGLLANLPA